MSEQVRPVLDVAAARKALMFFRVMAILVGIGLLVLCLGMVLKYVYDKPGLSDFWDQKHGLLYMVYVFATANPGLQDALDPGAHGGRDAGRCGAVPVVLGRGQGGARGRGRPGYSGCAGSVAP